MTQIGWELTEIKGIEVVEILRFEVSGLVEIWCAIIYFVNAESKVWPKFVEN